MAGPVCAFPVAVKCWLAAGLLGLLAACATPTAPPVAELAAAAPAPAQPAPAAPPPAPVAETPPPSRLADFIARRLRRHIEAPAPETETQAPAPAEAPVDEKYQLTGEAARELERGHASWYGGQFHGRRTASGENYDKYALTAAHKTLPFGTIVRVRSLKLGREVDVRINDRGPFSPGRVIDVSQAAAEVLGLTAAGVAEVSLNVADSPGGAARVSRSRKSPLPRRTARKPADPYRH
ncbi:MAG: septal ring lytic transglycosylase RlpA family protein [Polaromonas sp.]|jgi:rare lipoprotein A|nr:septal ring lytic transglycosylase RlpA family protein [Polaromonas sp.]